MVSFAPTFSLRFAYAYVSLAPTVSVRSTPMEIVLVVADGLGAVVLDLRGLVVVDGLRAVVADPVGLVLLDLDVLVLLGVDPQLLAARLVLEADRVGVAVAAALGRAREDARLRALAGRSQGGICSAL
jgi:hypothetical protein